MYVYCEKLILVSDPTRREWWRGLLRPGQRLFDQAQRCEAARNEEDAVSKALKARKDGFHPIVVCPTADSRERLGSLFHARRKTVRMLVAGYDDKNIGALLTSPSREVLLAWAGQSVLIEPSQAYRDALEQWIEAHEGARKFLQRVKTPELRLEDFDLVSRPDPDDTVPAREYRFEWRLNPNHHLALTLDPRKYEARLSYRIQENPSAGSLKTGEQEWTFGSDGKCRVDGRDLEWIANTFDLDDDQLRQWSLPAKTFTDMRTWLEKRIKNTKDALDALLRTDSEETPTLLNPFQWRTVIGAISLGQAAPTRAVGGRLTMPVRGPQHSPVRLLKPENLTTPLLQVLSSTRDLVLDVTWQPDYPRGTHLPKDKPKLVIEINGDKKEPVIAWENKIQRVVVKDLNLPEPFRYRWEWNGTTNELTVQIETLPETSAPPDAEGNE